MSKEMYYVVGNYNKTYLILISSKKIYGYIEYYLDNNGVVRLQHTPFIVELKREYLVYISK